MQRKREFCELLTVLSASSSMLGISKRTRLELEHLIFPDGDNDDHIHHTAASLIRTSTALQVLANMLSGVSHGPYNQWRKCFEFFEISLSWPDQDFRHEYRVGRPTFDRLVHLLEQNPIFQSTGKKPQRAVRYQLACFLLRYGSRGANPLQAAHKLAIGFGTVFLYCRRVVWALRELGIQVVAWGDAECRQETSQYIMDVYGFPDCVGMLDGMLIWLTQIPDKTGFSFICPNKFPINVQAIVDHKMRFISVDLGWPGSVSDVTMWKKLHVWCHWRDYFPNNTQVLADKGYPSSLYVLQPFMEPEIRNEPLHEKSHRRKFNQCLIDLNHCRACIWCP
ncbi:hypothetical protein BDR04DRAFT_1142230 [Suillus decipiens]|nr:hypothetical protein BDR04DRAFT_1142230 [Suillus decipiens]